MKLAAYSLALLALGISTNSTGQEARSQAFEGVECEAPEGWQAVAEQEPLYVVFGELHGTHQGPEFLGNLACALSSKGERVLLAIEHHAIHNAALQSAWNESGARFGTALVETGWAGRNDGVASEAMFDMLVLVHGLKERGHSISVVAFNGARDEDQSTRFADLPGQGPHEAAQAENIAQAAAAAKYDRVLVLVGSFHARKDMAQLGGVPVEPMARRLARLGRTVTLDMAHGGGSSWSCMLKPGFKPDPGGRLPEGALDCSGHTTRGNADFHRSPFIDLGTSLGDKLFGEYDGFYWVGPITASPPLLPASDR